MILTTNIVAKTMMDAVYHNRIPMVGSIKNGLRLEWKTAKQVEGYPRWWIVTMNYQSIKGVNQ